MLEDDSLNTKGIGARISITTSMGTHGEFEMVSISGKNSPGTNAGKFGRAITMCRRILPRYTLDWARQLRRILS